MLESGFIYFFGGFGGACGGTGTLRALISVFMLGAFSLPITTSPGKLKFVGFEFSASNGFGGILTGGFTGCFCPLITIFLRVVLERV
jgi:hypothetical protein